MTAGITVVTKLGLAHFRFRNAFVPDDVVPGDRAV